MVRDEEKYTQAVAFRKRGFTYSEIAKICGISKSTASAWLSKKPFSKRIAKENAMRAARDNKKRIGLMNKARTVERSARYQEAMRSAETEFKHYRSNPLFIAGCMLYLAKGDKTNDAQIRLTTSDVVVHKIFIRFCIEYLGVAKKDIHFWLLLYANQKEVPTMKRWSKHIGLSVAQFGKTQRIKQQSKSLRNGTGNTIIGSTVLKKKLLRFVELASKEV